MFRTANRSAKSTFPARRHRSRWSRARLWLQNLEERSTPAVLIVDSALDDNVGNTFRNVMATAKTNGQDDTIQFAAGVTNINLTLGELLYNGENFNLTIDGAGVTVAGAATASATNRIFNISVASGNPTVTINGLTMTKGNLSAGNGGAILVNNETLILNNVTLTGNRAGTSGGAIATAATGAKVTIDNSTVTSNFATTSGGVMFAPAATNSTITLTNSTFNGNQTAVAPVIQGSGTVTVNVSDCKFTNNAATGNGGTIQLAIATSQLTVNRTTFTNNSSGAGGAITCTADVKLLVENSTFNGNKTIVGNSGGAIRYTVAFTAGNYIIRNSTFTGNSTVFNGGALGFSTLSNVATIQNCTFTANFVTQTGGGGAIGVNSAGTGTISLESCIVSGNLVTGTGTGPDVFFTTGTVAGTTSLIGSASGITNPVFDVTTNNLSGQLPRLGPLFNNGGTTLTMGLRYNSPAINMGSNPALLPNDQRGAGFPRTDTVSNLTDIGAFEGVLLYPFADSHTLVDFPTGSSPYTFSVTLDDETGINTGKLATGDIVVKGPGGFTTINPTFTGFTPGTGNQVIASYSFNPPGGTWDTIDGGTYSVEFVPGKLFDTDTTPSSNPGETIGTFRVGIAGTMVVDKLGDIDDGNYGVGNLTLREAMGLSNASAGAADTITFDPALNGSTIVVSNGEFVPTDSFEMNGPGMTQLTISGNSTNRLFNFAFVGTALINNLTLANAFTAANGGAIIMNSSSLTATNVRFLNNSAGTIGGAINLGAATFQAFDCEFTGNSAGTVGGAAVGTGTGIIQITRSTIDGNTTTTSGSAIFANGAGTIVIVDSTVSNNISTGATGGAVVTTTGSITITNSTISGNLNANTAAVGGGIRITSTGKLIMDNSTVTKNSAGGGGGGIGFTGTSATTIPTMVVITSSIVAQNTHATHPDLFASATTVSVNVTLNEALLGASTDTDITILNNASQVGPDLANAINAKLAPLTNLGGSTKVHPLLFGSPALNAGSNTIGLMFDQRGTGFDRVLGGTADVGAFEGVIAIPSAAGTLPNVPPINPTYVVTVVYSDETGINTGDIDTNDVKLTGPGYAVAESPTMAKIISGMMGDKTVTVEYTFTPPGGSWDWPDNGTYTLQMQASQVRDTDAVPNFVPAGPLGTGTVSIALPPLVVDKLGDVDDGKFGVGELTLREAINLSNNVAGAATIGFSPALNGQTILLTSAFTITDSFDLNGPGASKLTISGGGTVQIFNLGVVNGLTVNLNGLTFSDGKSTANGAVVDMGGDSTLTVSDCVFKNGSSSLTGGALRSGAATGGRLTVLRSSFINNVAVNAGGAIYCRTDLLVQDCLFQGNSATSTTSTGGGAIAITNSGGARSDIIRNSTFTGNVSNNAGGAISLESSAGTIIIQNSTIVGNTANGANGGGGIARATGTADFLVESSIIALNLAPASTNPDIFTTGNVTANFSAITSSAGATGFIPDATTTALLGQDFKVGPLADNGGPTQTMALLAMSPALNAGSNPATLAFDQRGFKRDVGQVDIGAYESQPPRVSQVVVNGGVAQRSLVKTLQVVFSEPVTFPDGIAAAFDVFRYANGAAGSVSLAFNPMAGPTTVVNITFVTGGGVDVDPGYSLQDGTYRLTVNAAKVLGNGGTLDGNNNFASEGSPTDNHTTQFHRLFGDGNGDGAVNSFDFALFRGVFGLPGPSSPFDFNNDNSTNNFDFAQFRGRFGLSGYQP